MAQSDKQHIGDNQNPQWWGVKQGLFINSLANQHGEVTIDANWRATINQNTSWSLENWNKGSALFTNAFASFLNADTQAGSGFYWITGGRNVELLPQEKDNFIQFSYRSARRTGALSSLISTPSSILFHNTFSYNGALHYSQNPPIFSAFVPYINRMRKIKFISFFSGSPFLATDNLYPSGIDTIMRLNYGDETAGGIIGAGNLYINGVIRDFRIYTRIMTDQEVSNNYHSMTATNLSNLFCEWKLSQLSNFYTFGGNLYARNTGSSGNGLDNGTGYDMRLIGYNLNVPILTSIY